MQNKTLLSDGLQQNKQIHLNDVSSLSLKQRRKQSKQLQQQQQPLNTTASGGDSSDAETYTRALTAPNGLPTASQTTASAAPEPIATSGTTETCAGDGDAPKRRHSVGGGLRGASPVLGREGSIAMQTFPSHDLVQEVLHERTSSSSLTASPNNGRHAVRRKESVIKRKFRSAFPSSSSKHKREQLVRSDSSAINLSGTMDGGFAEHAKEVRLLVFLIVVDSIERLRAKSDSICSSNSSRCLSDRPAIASRRIRRAPAGPSRWTR